MKLFDHASISSMSKSPDSLKDQLMFLSTELATVNWIEDLISRNGSHCIKSRQRDLSFPPELWSMILDEAQAAALRDPKHCFVKIQSINAVVSDNVNTTVARCVGQKFELPYEPYPILDFYNNGKVLAGRLPNPQIVGDFEWYLQFATAERAAQINTQEVKEDDWDKNSGLPYASTTRIPTLVELPDQIFDVSISPSSTSAPSGLYFDLTVPDVISWVDNGNCWVCGGGRFICPGGRCPGPARHVWYFERVGCGYRVACPLCIARDIFSDTMEDARSQERGDDEYPEWKEELEKRIEERMKTLGYWQSRLRRR
ncbi:Putative protein of unknown function [Podospora comata]|uniref:Uncharacterized protein n=1 Tax=Podospora comata TaxID=48703 RepID=A0ABY6S4I4_PODCO|nr:Putative protein of unknown function [Podospora comata]